MPNTLPLSANTVGALGKVNTASPPPYSQKTYGDPCATVVVSVVDVPSPHFETTCQSP